MGIICNTLRVTGAEYYNETVCSLSIIENYIEQCVKLYTLLSLQQQQSLLLLNSFLQFSYIRSNTLNYLILFILACYWESHLASMPCHIYYKRPRAISVYCTPRLRGYKTFCWGLLFFHP